MQDEGVIKFELDYARSPSDPSLDFTELSAMRQRLWQLGLIGQSPDRYEGVGYGNVSRRIRPGELPFLVSGSQTGATEWLQATQYSRVIDFDLASNRVRATGPVPPSSEALTHGMLYELDRSIQVVLHVHSARIWDAADRLGLPQTRRNVAYGTPAMAHEVMRLFRDGGMRERGLFVMGGHRDGIIAFGDTVRTAGKILLDCHAHCGREE